MMTEERFYAWLNEYMKKHPASSPVDLARAAYFSGYSTYPLDQEVAKGIGAFEAVAREALER